ncbi:MAG: 50S ribosomal protein L1 [Candidatus Anoxychlamydiales bacterium]|nr:50S ribosomal protein L1 [Candidatus Anoxychlamydiales bacterium]NGX52516.1 50S ribosomal protein L1 [Candidatus Anoxychlamydiales bacterium]
MKKSKRAKKISQIVGEEKKLNTLEAIELLKKCPKLKFDESIEMSLKLGVDPKKSDQQVRGTVSLPHGSGKKLKVLVFAKANKVEEALDAGADYAGADEYVEKIKGGWLDFNAVIATPDMMREVGKLGKILGPRSLMPTPKSGTVTQDVAKAVKEIKAGKVEFKVDKNASINTIVGKLSFESKKLLENFETLMAAITKAKPSSSRGIYIRNLVLSSTMGPGIVIDLQSLNIT